MDFLVGYWKPDFTNAHCRQFLISGAVVGTSVLVAFWAGISLSFAFLLIVSSSLGYFSGYLLISNPNLCFSIQLIIGQFLGHVKEEEEVCPTLANVKRSSQQASIDKHPLLNSFDEENTESSTRKCRQQPWSKLKIGQRLNQELGDFIESLVDNFVNTWYKVEISPDNSFLLEIQYQIRYAASTMLGNLKDLDFTHIILDRLSPLAVVHLERVSRLSSMENANEKQLPPSTIELRILEQLTDLHWAMESRDNEMEYLRLLADLIVESLADESRIGGQEAVGGELPDGSNLKCVWPSHSCRHLLRELVLFTVLIPLMDFLADPDTLNRLILAALSPNSEVLSEDCSDESDKVDFLGQFADLGQSHAPDSLLCLKLSDLVKEPRLIQLFDMYLRDINGPNHLLDCFLQARDIHKRIRMFHTESNASEERKAKELSEIQSDAWQLYSGFIHPSAPNRVECPAAVREEFALVVEQHQQELQSPHLLEKVAEDVYKEIYQQLHYNYVIPFCQSENYLGYLCGAPPDVEELLMRRSIGGSGSASVGLKPGKAGAEPSFSLSQFRNKLFHVIGTNNNSSAPALSSSLSKDIDEGIEVGGSISTTSEARSSSSNLQGFETGNIALIDLGRDLNKWIITIPTIEPRREAISSKMYYVYVINIERNDLAAECFNGFNNSEEELMENADFDDTLLALGTWTIGRKYDEFFVLEEKLREYHGNSVRLGLLPDKKVFRAKNRSFMDAHRPFFERFMQTLVQQPALKRSDLLYAFLTNEEEMLDEGGGVMAFPDLNPLRAMRRVPNKLSRERGQSLKPFILNVLANILAPRTALYTSTTPQQQQQTSNQLSVDYPSGSSPTPLRRAQSEQRWELFLNHFCLEKKVDGVAVVVTKRAKQARFVIFSKTIVCEHVLPVVSPSKFRYLFSSVTSFTGGASNKQQIVQQSSRIALDNVPIQLMKGKRASNGGVTEGSEKLQGNLHSIYDMFLFLMLRLARLAHWVEALLIMVKSLFLDLLISRWIRLYIDRLLHRKILTEQMASFLVQSLNELVFDAQSAVSASDEERRLRADLVLHCLDEAVEDGLPSLLIRLMGGQKRLRLQLRDLFHAFQLPRLNKQLVFVLMDRLIEDQLSSRKRDEGNDLH